MKRIILLLTLILISTTIVNAELSLLEPKETYSLGDKLYVTAEGIKGSEDGNLNINLLCGNKSTSLVKFPARAFDLEKEESYSLPYKILNHKDLEINNLEELLGTCTLTATTPTQSTTSKTFTISKDITINAKTDKTSYNPGETVTIQITANKANKEPLEGIIESKGAHNFNKAVIKGTARETFTIQEGTAAGTYAANLTAYDQDENGRLNEGTGILSFTIKQIPTSITPILSAYEIQPGETLSINTKLLDQSKQEMKGTITITLTSPEGEEETKNAQSGTATTFPLAKNAKAGTWKIKVNAEGLQEEQEISVGINKEVNTEIIDSVLVVTNIGNTLYDQPITVEIGGEEQTIELAMEVGTTKRFSLEAPNGEYEVNVNDGKEKKSSIVLLTGNSIGVNDTDKKNLFTSYAFVWIFLILILITLITLFILKSNATKKITEGNIFNKIKGAGKSIGNLGGQVKQKVPQTMKKNLSDSLYMTKKSPLAHSLDEQKEKKNDPTLKDLTNKNIGTAESTLVMDGQKYNSTILCLAIKNMESLTQHALEEIEKIGEISKKYKGLVDKRGEYLFIVFSPMITKTYDNEGLALSSALAIRDHLEMHNQKFKSKIHFNLGVHTGELVTSREKGKLRYTSIGNTLPLAKKMADFEIGKVFVSETIRKKMLRELKLGKAKETGSTQTYEVLDLKDTSKNQEKLKDILRRMNS
jgi:hypothetical protein